ncbi:hypothetical protein K505DRAFT_405029 [Melanomma pulvis-pyrius CBS 109.77]|uniref:FAD-binding PCMH-type domain-containing protein n=1 Tax=Melanomma pulvis-pyrius CBS 109.77 TaxID=1314802 RepID=A0A6A6XSZ6_9PLEO|nr:hypothetical protein K505DRAFT_405029 [Melanomma pulvis-pyrius CBS 109.77]
MATLECLKLALEQKAKGRASSPKQPLSDKQRSAGFNILEQGTEWRTYQDSMISQLSQLLAPLFTSRVRISALEIGPGQKSVLGHLPGDLRCKIRRYSALEPNGLFATELEKWLCPTSKAKSPLPSLENPPDIHRIPFVPQDNKERCTSTGTWDNDEKYDIILFCHSTYGMNLKRRFIERALEMLVERPRGGMVVILGQDEALHLDGLVCHRTASLPSEAVRLVDDDGVLDCFAAYVTGFTMQNGDVDKAVRADWREVCRALGRREEAHQGHLLFSLPNVMATFTQDASTLPELMELVPWVKEDKTIKNWEARLHRPALVIRPTEVRHVQQCVQWALKHGVGLAVIGGGHTGHCLWPNVVSIDMAAFDQISILTAGEAGTEFGSDSGPLVVAGAGCKTGDIVRRTMAAGLTVPLGARPSVGAGLWLQGGIGHLARLHGLACDAILGAVVVSVDSSQVLYVGCVPSQYRPVGAVRPESEADLLWAMKGAGTNFGIVVSVTFRAYTAPSYCIRNRIIPLSDRLDALRSLDDFDKTVAEKAHRNHSSDAYLYWDSGQLQLGVTEVRSSTAGAPNVNSEQEVDFKTVNGVGLFETEMYVSRMHGGHGGGKTSSFKRCLFLKRIGDASVGGRLVAAIEQRPTPLCYVHLQQGGGAVGDVAADGTAFGCRDWDYACVITGVWGRDQDGTDAARRAVQWVYDVAAELLALSSGAYGADLGPDPRDAGLAAKAFGPNGARLARLKRRVDPGHVLAYACPLPAPSTAQRLIVLVTGDSGAGKDYCAQFWASEFVAFRTTLTARVVSISDATKQEYAAATGADLGRLLENRAYKEQHRPALTAFFEEQVRLRPQLPEEHFLNVVHGAADVDVLLVTGMRDGAPVAAFSHLVPDSRLLEVHVYASQQKRRIRRGRHGGDGHGDDNGDSNNGLSSLVTLDHRPSLLFNNDTSGDKEPKHFAARFLLPFFDDKLQRLANMARPIPDFPHPGIEFRHVLGIAQQPGGLALCTSLLQQSFIRRWANIDAVVGCEAGGFVYASALASVVNVPLVLVREAGKLPPPTVSVLKSPSHISSLASNNSKEKRIEMEQDVLPRGASVVVVDDVLSTGETLCAVLQLLEAAIGPATINIMVVAEFPVHRGRELLRRHGFGNIDIQSLLVFGGA